MSKSMGAQNLDELIKFERELYLEKRKQHGGDAAGFRKWIINRYGEEPDKYLEALAAAADKGWRQRPREVGDDLFSIKDMKVAQYLTRPKSGAVEGDDIEDDEDTGTVFQKVHCKYATVADLEADATIKLRKAAQSSASAERKMKQVDEARKRARGDVSKFIRDLAD